jgi:riboflavin-specific deaminase-like protein
MQRLFFGLPDPNTPFFDLKEVYTVPELAFPLGGVPLSEQEGTARRPYIYFNMVSSVDGRATTESGNAEGLGSDTDREMMYRLRAGADAVLCGASTFRRDQFLPAIKPWLVEERARFFPTAPELLGCVLSNSGDLPLDKKFWQAGRAQRAVFLGPKATEAQAEKLSQHARVFRLDPTEDGRANLKQMLTILYAELGVQRLLVEGGPELNYALISDGFGDELFWTLAPKLVGGVDNLTILGGAGRGFSLSKIVQLQLLSIYNNNNELFMRYRLLPRL